MGDTDLKPVGDTDLKPRGERVGDTDLTTAIVFQSSTARQREIGGRREPTVSSSDANLVDQISFGRLSG